MKLRLAAVGSIALSAVLLSGCTASDPATDNRPGVTSAATESATTIGEGTKAELQALSLDEQFDFSKAVPFKVEGGSFAGLLNGNLLFNISGDPANVDSSKYQSTGLTQERSLYSPDGKLIWNVKEYGTGQVISWDDKQYLAVFSAVNEKADKDSMSKTEDATTDLVRVLDPETGELVHEHKSVRTYTNGDGGWEEPTTWTKGRSGQSGLLYAKKAVVGNNTQAQNSYFKTVNPLTGETIKEHTLPEPQNSMTSQNVTTFVGVAPDGGISTENESEVPGKLVNTLSISGLPDMQNSGGSHTTGRFLTVHKMLSGTPQGKPSILEATTGKQVAQLGVCGTNDATPQFEADSPNGTILAFSDEVVDTKSGKAICVLETATQKGIKPELVDNEGNIYGASSSSQGGWGYLLNLETGKSTAIGGAPVSITDKGEGIFAIEVEGDSEPDYVLAPAK